MFRLKRGPRTTQPQGAARIDWGNPLAQNLVFCAVPVGGGWVDLVTGTHAENTNAQTLTPERWAKGFPAAETGQHVRGSASGHWRWPEGMPADLISGPFTVYQEGAPVTNSVQTSAGSTFSSGDTAVGSGIHIAFDDATAFNNSWAVYTNRGAGAGATTTYGSSNVLGASFELRSHRVTASFDGANIRLFSNGKFDKTAACTAPALQATRRTRILAQYSDGTTVGRATSLAMVAVWKGSQSDRAVLEVQRNPWQLFAPAERRIWGPSAGGGASSATLATTGETGTFAGAASSPAIASLSTTGGTGTFSATASSPATAALATSGGAGAFAATASSPAVAALAATGGAGAFSGAANSTTTVAAAITGETGTFAGTTGASTSAALAATGASGVFAGTANSTTNATAAITGETGTFAGFAGTGTSASLAAAGESGVFAGTASAPSSVALAALGGKGAFAGSAYPLTTAQVAALGESGTFSGAASTVGTASLATTGDSGAFSGSVISIGSAYLAALGDSGTFAGSASVAAPSTVGRPASDVSNSGWAASVGSDLYAMLDEVTPAPSDYIVAASVGAVCEVALNATSYPGTAAQILKFRASSSTGNSLIVRLRNVGGATVRSATQALTPTDTEYQITLTAGEIAAITSGALSVQLESA